MRWSFFILFFLFISWKGEKPTTGKDPVETVRPIDCGDINKNHGNGVYKIYPKKSKTGFRVFCDFKTDGGGWTVSLENCKNKKKER